MDNMTVSVLTMDNTRLVCNGEDGCRVFILFGVMDGRDQIARIVLI